MAMERGSKPIDHGEGGIHPLRVEHSQKKKMDLVRLCAARKEGRAVPILPKKKGLCSWGVFKKHD